MQPLVAARQRFYAWYMLRRLYDDLITRAARPDAGRWLSLVAFTESSFFPLPPDIMLIPMVLARPHAAWRLAGLATFWSVAGAGLGYLIGALFYETMGAPLVAFYGYEAAFARFAAAFADWGVWIILIFGLSILPFKVITIASGLAGMNPLWFLLLCVPARGGRFFLVAGLLRFYGAPLRIFIERRLTLLVSAAMLLGILGYLALGVIRA